MSEDYKKIALEDVKVGQRVRIVEQYPSHIATYEGVVFQPNPECSEISLGDEGDEDIIFVGDSEDSYTLLLEDVPEPKVVRTETVTITHYDDGTTTTQTSVDAVPSVIETPDQFEEYEENLKQAVLKDIYGDYWTCREVLVWGFKTPNGTWRAPSSPEAFENSLPMTVVENVGD